MLSSLFHKLTLDPITPSNIVIKNATRRGSKEGIKPVSAEGGTLFIQREGKALREFYLVMLTLIIMLTMSLYYHHTC